MDNHQNLVNCCICGVSDKPIVSLKVEYSHQMCELLGKNDIFLQENSAQQINKPSWNNCYHCLDLISKLKLLLSKQAQILDQIKEKIAKGIKGNEMILKRLTFCTAKKNITLLKTPEIKEEEEEEEYKSETEFEPSQFFCKIEVDPDPEDLKHEEDEVDPASPTPTEEEKIADLYTITPFEIRRPKSPPGPQTCPTCNKVFHGRQSKSRLRVHIAHVHGKVKNFSCPYCRNNKAFATKQLWLRHLLQKHEILTTDKPLSCTFCPKKFAISQLYERHVENHTKFDEISPFFCPICDTRFKQEEQLKRHTVKSCQTFERVKDKNKYPCSLCNINFFKPVKLAIHERLQHADRLTWICPTCGSPHLAESHLATHSLLHEDNADSYSCLVCKRASFTTKDDLSLHLSSCHTGEETVPCGVPGCLALFSSLADKFHHLGSVHNEAAFSCSSCDEKFLTLSAKVAHEGCAHRDAGVESFPCEWEACGDVYSSRELLRKHVVRVHKPSGPKICEICGKELTTLGSYRDHMKIHSGVKDLICEVCGRGFSCVKILRDHRVTHTGERPFKCKLCEKAYTQRHVLKSHVRKVHGGGGS
ncbi:oocyte zinc finger protein XlCOF6 isoform X2 [Folsomia candida]|uniref:oocyte zinc finger protein XlCOF6 isoform X2 n=1 Tax=Folsomia candida TaxID=158441 RepID=UPI0016052B59|nr:oocyte zinc finger protein XlCOF6 isoform X2 [Folsomia candida]